MSKDHVEPKAILKPQFSMGSREDHSFQGRHHLGMAPGISSEFFPSYLPGRQTLQGEDHTYNFFIYYGFRISLCPETELFFLPGQRE